MIDGKEVIRKIIESHPAQEPARNFIGTDDQIKKWINDSYDKICKSPGGSGDDRLGMSLSKLSWNDDALDAAPMSLAVPTPASPPATLSFNADHAWDMVVLAARASRYE